MSGEFGLRSLDAMAGILLLLQVLAMGWFALAVWRSGAGRVRMVFLILVVAYGALEGVGMLSRLATLLFPYTSGTESLWMLLWSGNTVLGILKAAALLGAAVVFLKLALTAKKSRRA